MIKFKSKAFTIAELMVVIVILSILGTIAFVTYQGYLEGARDTKRSSDVVELVKVVDLAKIKSVYPSSVIRNGAVTTLGLSISGARPKISMQGSLNFDMLGLDEQTFKDPNGNDYVYGYAIGSGSVKEYFQVGTINESEGKAIIVGDYKKLLPSDSESIIFYDKTDVTTPLVVNGGNVLPYNVNGGEINTSGTTSSSSSSSSSSSTSSSTSSSGGATGFFKEPNGTIKCPGIAIGDTSTIEGVEYLVVDNSLFDIEISKTSGQRSLCTTNVTDMSSSTTSASVPETYTDVINIGNWDVSNVTNMSRMFYHSQVFNQDISSWDVSSVTNMSYMFYNAHSFDRELGNWNVSSVTNMESMFNTAATIGLLNSTNLNSWNVSNVTNMSNMFNSAYNIRSDFNNWDVSNVTNMNQMFKLATSFNGNISTWNVSKVNNMVGMFDNAHSFNGDLNNWNVSLITDMSYMFNNAFAFFGTNLNWNVSNVTNMSHMFDNAQSFRGSIGGWNVSNVTNMSYMFNGAATMDLGSTNWNISNWNVSNVTNMSHMFNEADTFNQNLSSWCVTNITSKPTNFDRNTYSWSPKSSKLPVWGTCN